MNKNNIKRLSWLVSHQDENVVTTLLTGRTAIQDPFTNIEALLHELQTHQIQLEAQEERMQQAKVALQIIRDLFVEAFESTPLGYIMIDQDGIVINCNQTAAGMLNIEQGRLINSRFTNHVPEEHRDRWIRHFLAAWRNRGIHSLELELLKIGGANLFTQLSFMYVDKEYFLPHLRITVTDLSENKLAEKNQLLATMSLDTQDGIIVTDKHKLILHVNKAFTRSTGYAPAEVLGNNPLILMSERHDQALIQEICVSRSTPKDKQKLHELWIKRKNGLEFPAALNLIEITDSEGGISHYVFAFKDIDEQEQAFRLLLKPGNQELSTQNKQKYSETEFPGVTKIENFFDQTEKIIADTKSEFLRSIEESVLPYLKKLRSVNSARIQSVRLIDLIENNIRQITRSFGHENGLPIACRQLSSAEKQVALMVKQGQSTKMIAATLNLSIETISVHRKHIRKKLGLGSKSINLQSYLESLED